MFIMIASRNWPTGFSEKFTNFTSSFKPFYMKIFVPLLFCLFFSYGKNVNALPDSTVVYDCVSIDDGDSSANLVIYRYDGAGNFLGYSSSSWNGFRQVENHGSVNTYSNDSLHHLIKSETAYNRTSYFYDSVGNVIEEIKEDINNGIPVNRTRQLYTYNGHLPVQAILQTWNQNAWLNSGRTDYFYDNNQNDSCELAYTWNGQNWMNSTLKLSFYHPNDQLDFDTLFFWNVVDAVWNIHDVDTITYDSNWNILEYLTYEFSTGVGVYNERSVYTYDSNGYETSYSNEQWDGNSWMPNFWGSYLRNASGNILYSTSDCAGCGFFEASYFYDNHGNLIHYQSNSETHGGLQSSTTCNIYQHAISGIGLICENGSTILSADPGYSAYIWSNGSTNQSIVVNQAGTYSVSMLNSNGIWESSAPFRTAITYAAVAPQAADSSIVICRNNGVGLSIPADPHYEYEWILNDDSVVGGSYIGNNFYSQIYSSTSQSGCYRLVVRSGCDVDTSSRTCIQFKPDSLASISSSGGILDAFGRLHCCVGDTITLTASQGNSYYWPATGDTSRSIHVSRSGSYSVQVYTTGGCYSTATMSISQYRFTTSTEIRVTDSTVYLTPAYSSPSFHILWLLNGDTIPTQHDNYLLNPATGYYQAIVTMMNTCYPVSISNVQYFSSNAYRVFAGFDQSSCYGNGYSLSLGSNLQVFNGFPPYTYNWSPAIGLNNPNQAYPHGFIDSLIPGQQNQFVLTVTDSHGNIARDTVQIMVYDKPAAPIATVLNTDTICANQSNNSVLLTPSGSGISYSFGCLSGNCSVNFANNEARLYNGGTYQFYYYLNGCRSFPSSPLTVNAYPGFSNPSLVESGTTSFCFGDSVQLTVQPNSVSYSYLWNDYTRDIPDAESPSYTAYYEGYFRVKVTNEHGCWAFTNQVYVDVDTAFLFEVNQELPSVVCHGDSVKLWIDAALYPNYSFQWIKEGSPVPGANDSTFFVKTTGHYSLMMYPPGNSCAGSSQDVFIQVRQPVPLNVVQSGNTLTALTSSWNYQWYQNGIILPGDTNHTLIVNTNGYYNAVVTDYHGCSRSEEVLFNCGASFIKQDALCPGDCNGSVDATLLGIQPLSAIWSTGDTSLSLTGLCAGSYYLIVSDTLGCIDTAFVTVNDPLPVSLSTFIDSPVCPDGCVMVHPNPSGGSPPYTYLWCNGSTNMSIHACQPDTCLLNIVDSHGCSFVFITVIQIPLPLIVNVSVQGTSCIGCNDGIITVQNGSSPSLALTSWSPPNGILNGLTLSGLPSATYTLTYTDSNLCDTMITVFVPEDPTGIVNQIDAQVTTILPNPATTEFVVHTGRTSTLYFYNSIGDLLEFSETAGEDITYAVHDLAKGIYFLKIISGKNMEVMKIVLE